MPILFLRSFHLFFMMRRRLNLKEKYSIGGHPENDPIMLPSQNHLQGFFDEEANWVNYMDLNGDEQHIQMEEKVTILKAVFYEF